MDDLHVPQPSWIQAPPLLELEIDDLMQLLAFVHPGARVSPHALIGGAAEWRRRVTRYAAMVMDGAIVREFARVHAGVERHTFVGERTLLMAGSHVGHDASIGDDVDLAPNVVIGGLVTIGDRTKVGMGAVVVPHVTIGAGCRIGAGAVVARDVPDGEIWAGVPAKQMAPR